MKFSSAIRIPGYFDTIRGSAVCASLMGWAFYSTIYLYCYGQGVKRGTGCT